MKYLKRFWKTFKDYFHRTTELALPKKVDSNEPLSRYIFNERHIDVQHRRIKPGAFIPPANSRLSVFRISGLLEDIIWDIGKKVGNISHRKLCGRADVIAFEFEKRGFQIEANDNPPRHADIIRWPDEKAKRLSIAQELAEIAKLSIYS